MNGPASSSHEWTYTHLQPTYHYKQLSALLRRVELIEDDVSASRNGIPVEPRNLTYSGRPIDYIIGIEYSYPIPNIIVHPEDEIDGVYSMVYSLSYFRGDEPEAAANRDMLKHYIYSALRKEVSRVGELLLNPWKACDMFTPAGSYHGTASAPPASSSQSAEASQSVPFSPYYAPASPHLTVQDECASTSVSSGSVKEDGGPSKRARLCADDNGAQHV